MASGWNVNVYRTDGEEEKYIGFFLDDAEADKWIKKQSEGTYEKRTKGYLSSEAGSPTVTEEQVEYLREKRTK